MINIKAIAIATALAFVAGGGSGFWAKTKLVQAAQKSSMEKALVALGEKSQTTLDGLQGKWENLVEKNNQELINSAQARIRDTQVEAETAKTLKETGDAIRKLKQSISLADNVGVCVLTDDFIQLWNDINTASRTRSAGGEG